MNDRGPRRMRCMESFLCELRFHVSGNTLITKLSNPS